MANMGLDFESVIIWQCFLSLSVSESVLVILWSLWASFIFAARIVRNCWDHVHFYSSLFLRERSVNWTVGG